MDRTNDIQQMTPFIVAIADELKVMSEDTEGKFHKYAEETIGLSDFFRNGLEDCCAAHRFEHIASIQIYLDHVAVTCTCDDNLNHDFIRELCKIIGKHMSKCVEDAMINQMMAERVN